MSSKSMKLEIMQAFIGVTGTAWLVSYIDRENSKQNLHIQKDVNKSTKK